MLLLSGCGSNGPSTSPSPHMASGTAGSRSADPAAMDTLTIRDFHFASITVSPGAQVTVVNTDRAPHTLTVKDAGIDVRLDPGARGMFTAPSTPGTYALTCDIHPAMQGTLTVQG